MGCHCPGSFSEPSFYHATRLHEVGLSKITPRLLADKSSAPMSFLSNVETGALVTRFSQDIRLVDMILPRAFISTGFRKSSDKIAKIPCQCSNHHEFQSFLRLLRKAPLLSLHFHT